MAEKKVTTAKTEPTKVEEPKVETPKAEEPKAKSNGGTKMKMQDLKPISFTQKEFAALDPSALQKALCEPLRISRERGKAFLVEKVANGKINSISPEVLMDWTYKAVRIKGTEIKGQGFTADRAKETMTKAEFGKLTPKAKAELLAKYTHKRRAADTILPGLIGKGMPLSPADVVYITNGRVEIEGVEIAKKQKVTQAVVDGVTFE